ncbi:MAG: imidazolonepropionase [Nitrospiria bacterium]
MKRSFDLAILNCGELLTLRNESDGPKTGDALSDLGLVHQAAVGIVKEQIAWVGRQRDYRRHFRAKREIDADGKVVMPGFVDPHTHAVFAGRRDEEWAARLQGTPYLEILEKGGGILRTVAATRAASPTVLFKQAETTLHQMLAHGTTTVEIKSGYGLDPKTETRILKVIQRLGRETPLDVVATYLGAHVVPKAYRGDPEAYVAQVMASLPKMKALADFCDVFCEAGAFSFEQSERILAAAQDLGFGIKLHAGEFSEQGGLRLAAAFKAASVDHLDIVKKRDLSPLARAGTVGVLLPGVSHFLGHQKHAPARRLIDAGIPIALATDYNPGSCPCLSMQEIIHLAVLNLKMRPAEATAAATINAAHAVGRGRQCGSIEVGKQADLLILDLDHHGQLPYFFGVNHVRRVLKKGVVVS